MSQIYIKLPQRKRNLVKIIRDEQMISEEYRIRDEKLGLLLKPPVEEVIEPEIIEEVVEVEEEIKEIPPPVYTQEFIFANANEPIIIDLGNIPEPALPIRIVQEEIQKSYDRGVEDGHIQAKVTFQIETDKYKSWMRRIDGIVDALSNQSQSALKKFEESVINVSLMVAEHILGHEASDNATLVLEQVRKAISSLDNDSVFKINVHPDSVKILEETKSSLLANREDSRKIIITADSSVEPGGCVLETTAGIIDARIKSQLDMLRNPLGATIEDINRLESEQNVSAIEAEEIERLNDPARLEQEEMQRIWGKAFFDENYNDELVALDEEGKAVVLDSPEEDYALPLDKDEIEEIIKLDNEFSEAIEDFAKKVEEDKLEKEITEEDDFSDDTDIISKQDEISNEQSDLLLPNDSDDFDELDSELMESLEDAQEQDDSKIDNTNENKKQDDNKEPDKNDDENFDLDNFIFS